jgi:hypothetical protein
MTGPVRRLGVLSAVTAAVAATTLGVVAAPPAAADANCALNGPPLGALYGQQATLWITSDSYAGISTAEGTGSVQVHTPSPIVQQALLIDAQQDGQHQILVDTGRETNLYAASGCTITTVVDKQGEPFFFDEGHRRGNGDGVGCGDLGNGPHLVGFLNLVDQPVSDVAAGAAPGMMRRTEIDLDGATATIGRSDVVPTSTDISCGGLTMQSDGLSQP